MELDFAFLCDYAEHTHNGKIAAVGAGFENIHASAIPVQLGRMCIVARFLAEDTQSESDIDKSVRFQVVDPNGKEVGEITGVIRRLEGLSAPKPNESNVSGVNIIVGLEGLRLAEWGDYWLNVFQDGQERKRIGFSLVQQPSQDRAASHSLTCFK